MLRLERISRSFGATQAVDEVSLSVESGVVTALIGENGAGKTTLMRIAADELRPDSGRVETDGRVELVHQHFMLVADFTIAENLALALGRPRWIGSPRAFADSASRLIAGSGIELGDVKRRVSDLSVGEKSKLELVKAILRSPATLILDEPTSVLTPQETGELFEVMRRLTAAGTAVVLISHKLPEVLEVAGRIVVMRAGRIVLDEPRGSADASRLTAAMVDEEGLPPPLPPTPTREGARTRLVADRVRGEILDDVSFSVAEGEIAAIVGVAGNGQVELAAMLRGLRRPHSGSLSIDAVRTAHIPEDRTRDGIVGEMSIAENLALAAPAWSPPSSAAAAARAIESYSIRAKGPSQRVRDLSGGNQQKVVLARELGREPEVVIAAEPTRGLDIESTRFVHGRLRGAAQDGAAILLITSDLDEALSLAASVYVIYRGRLSAKLPVAEAQPRLASLMAGLW